MFFKRHEVLLILGNGFDLSLGLPTSYNNFVESELFKKRVNIKHYPNAIIDLHDRNIHNYLTLQKNLKNWIDVEMELMKYATRQRVEYHNDRGGLTSINIVSDGTIRTFYNLLCLDLQTYIKSIDLSKIDRKSLSLLLLKQVSSRKNNQIVTFNYTDLEQLLGDKPKCGVKYIHGYTMTKILLGFQRFNNMAEGYEYMIKSENPDYKSCHLSDKMLEVDEIIIFGHSMGITDHFYFQKFFDTQVGADAKHKQLTIFTKDNSSKESITRQLVTLANKKYNLFLDNTNVDIISTQDNEVSVAAFIKELSKRQRMIHL